MARLRFLMARKRPALYGVLLVAALPAVAAAGTGIGIPSGVGAAPKKKASTTTLRVRPARAGQGQTVTFIARVTFGAAFAPAGTPVVFRVDGTKVAASATTAGGVAKLSTRVATPSGSMIAGGTHRVTAGFAGTANVNPSRASARFFVKCPGRRGGCESLLAHPTPAVGTSVYPGQTLSIVAINDGPIGTSGALAPSAVLSTGQSLVVTTAATTGQPAEFVTTHTMPENASHQLLLSFTLPGDLVPGRYRILVTAFEADDDSDQWYWPITVLAIPPAVPFTIAGRITTPLYPGRAPSPIDLSFSNPNVGNGGSGAIGVQVSSLTVTVSGVSAPAATPELPCTVDDFAVTQFSGVYPFVIPHGKSSLGSLGFAQRTWPAVRLRDRRVNQDGCEGATISLAYSGAS